MNDKYIMGVDPYDDNNESKVTIFKNGELIDLRHECEKEEIEYKKQELYYRNLIKIKKMNPINNPKELGYWRNIFPTKTDEELEEYRVKWSKENPKYLKFKNL